MGKYDISELIDFISEYLNMRDASANKIVLRRSREPFGASFYWLTNPDLKFDVEELMFTPEPQMKIRNEEHHYVTLACFRERNWGPYFKITNYSITDYGAKKLNLMTTILNKLMPFEETSYKLRDSNKLLLHKDEFEELDNAEMGPYRIRLKQKKSRKTNLDKVYISDIPWPERNGHYFGDTILPFLFNVNFTLGPNGCWMHDYSHEYDVALENNDIINVDYSVTSSDLDHFRSLWYRVGVDKVIRNCVDTSLLEFLHSREIPILRALFRALRNAQISDLQLDFLNDVMEVLGQIKNKNALEYFISVPFFIIAEVGLETKRFSYCHYCHKLIRYRRNKIYCSLSSEGRDCGKKARNRRDYQKHRDKRLAYYRNEMRTSRKFIQDIIEKDSANT